MKSTSANFDKPKATSMNEVPQIGFLQLSENTNGLIRDHTDPNALTPHERLRELAAILASGMHRLRALPPVQPERCEIPSESSPSSLEPVATTRPDGRCLQRESAEMNNAH